MFVEINGRQSGKTTRLMVKLVEYLIDNPHHKINIVGYKLVNALRIKKDIELILCNRFNYLNVTQFRNLYLKRIVTSSEMKPGFHHYFIDEFDFIKPERLFIWDDAYYCTTIGRNSQFTQSLLEVWEEKNNGDKIKPIEDIKKFKFV